MNEEVRRKRKLPGRKQRLAKNEINERQVGRA